MMKRTLIRTIVLAVAAMLLVHTESRGGDKSSTPEWLYLVFTDSTTPQQDKVPTTMWFHPTAPDSCARTFEQSFFPGHERDHKAFSIAITEVTPAGYEVTFQRVDPETQKALDIAPVKFLFARATESSTHLTDKVTVVGHYESAPPFKDM